MADEEVTETQTTTTKEVTATRILLKGPNGEYYIPYTDKQDKLTAGAGITISDDNVIASTTIEESTGQFPEKSNLTSWARLADGNLYNMPLKDVNAESNQFIVYSNRKQLIIKKNTFIKLDTSTGTRMFCVWADTTVNVESILDTGSTLTNGKDYSLFIVPDGDNDVALKCSLNKTAPEGYTTTDTRRIGGFHTLCADAGTITTSHSLNGWYAGDIIPNSVWTLWHKPAVASPSGARYVPERDAWKTIYRQSGTGKNTVFEYGATVTRSRTTWDHELDLASVGWEFPTSLDFTISEQGIVPLKAVYGKAEASCTKAGGWKNENSIRMLTDGGDESTCGGLWTILQERGPAGGSDWKSSGTTGYTDSYTYGTIYRLLGGGRWTDSGYAGPSARNGVDLALNTNTAVSALGWSRPLRSKGAV